MLLDTHVLLWLLTASTRLGSGATDVITRAGRVHFSSVSIAEARVKQILGRLVIPDDFAGRLGSQGLCELPLSAAHADRLADFPDLVRHDPFDRLLMAQAATEGMSLLTADRRLLGLGLTWIVDASA